MDGHGGDAAMARQQLRGRPAIFATRTVSNLVVGSDIAIDDLGTRSLKGVGGAWQLFAARP
jgi:hypothetical protein